MVVLGGGGIFFMSEGPLERILHEGCAFFKRDLLLSRKLGAFKTVDQNLVLASAIWSSKSP